MGPPRESVEGSGRDSTGGSRLPCPSSNMHFSTLPMEALLCGTGGCFWLGDHGASCMKSHIESSVQMIMMERDPRLINGAPPASLKLLSGPSCFALPLALKTVHPGSRDDGEVPQGSDAQMTTPTLSVTRSVKRVLKRSQVSDYAGSPVVKTLHFHRRALVQVRYLMRKLRSHVPCSQKFKSSKISERIR